MSRLTPRQEAFAMAFVETGNASEAYRQAYPRSRNWKPETVYSKASHMLADDKVSARVAELKAEHRERHQITVDTLSEEAMKALRMAAELQKPNDMIRAIDQLAKLHGLHAAEKRELSIPGGIGIVRLNIKHIGEAGQ